MLDIQWVWKSLTNFGMKNSLTLPSLANKYSNSLRDENDEPIFTYTDPFKRNFVRNSIKDGGCNAFNQHYKSEISNEFFIYISRKLNVNSNICNLLEKYFEVSKKYEKLYAKELVSKYEDIEILSEKKKQIILTII